MSSPDPTREYDEYNESAHSEDEQMNAARAMSKRKPKIQRKGKTVEDLKRLLAQKIFKAHGDTMNAISNLIHKPGNLPPGYRDEDNE